jgi:hypothetical protein
LNAARLCAHQLLYRREGDLRERQRRNLPDLLVKEQGCPYKQKLLTSVSSETQQGNGGPATAVGKSTTNHRLIINRHR